MGASPPSRFGRYELLAEIGRGGMAELFLGRLTGLGGFSKLVAIKRILPHLSLDDRFVEMFLNEGRIAARLSHPNVCQVFELGEVDGELFLAMEYLEGVSLGELMTAVPRDPVLLLRLAASVLGQACDGLHYAHELRDAIGQPTPVVHRDMSPHNLFVTTDGVCKLLDFGVSKVVTDTDQTRSGLIKGKLPYMPPEQVRGEAIDARVDVFSMGVVLWELMTGERLFVRASDFLIWKAIMEDPIPSVRTFHAVYGADLEAVIAGALARDRADRTPTIRVFADALRRAAAPHGGAYEPAEVAAIVRGTCAAKLADRSRVLAALIEPAHAAPAVTAFAEEPSVTHSISLRDGSVSVKRPRARRRWPLIAIGVGVLALLGVGTAIGVRATDAEVAASVAPEPAVPDAAVRAAVEPGEPVDTSSEELALIELDPPPSPEPTAPSPDERAPRLTRSTRPRGDASPAVAEHGYFSVDSNPYATIFVDGKRVDQTPLFKVSLPVGRHRIRAVRADGRERTFTIRIAAGKHVSSGTLSW